MSQNTYFAHPSRPVTVFCSTDSNERARLKRRGWVKVPFEEARRICGGMMGGPRTLSYANEICGSGEYDWSQGHLQCKGNGASNVK